MALSQLYVLKCLEPKPRNAPQAFLWRYFRRHRRERPLPRPADARVRSGVRLRVRPARGLRPRLQVPHAHRGRAHQERLPHRVRRVQPQEAEAN